MRDGGMYVKLARPCHFVYYLQSLDSFDWNGLRYCSPPRFIVSPDDCGGFEPLQTLGLLRNISECLRVIEEYPQISRGGEPLTPTL